VPRSADAWVWLEFQEYFVASDPAAFRVLPNLDIPLSVYVGVAGMPGQTASYSWQVRLAFRPWWIVLIVRVGVLEGQEGGRESKGAVELSLTS
jgi:hypothetical protein